MKRIIHNSNQIILNGEAANKRIIHVSEGKRNGSSKYFSRIGVNVNRRTYINQFDAVFLKYNIIGFIKVHFQ